MYLRLSTLVWKSYKLSIHKINNRWHTVVSVQQKLLALTDSAQITLCPPGLPTRPSDWSVTTCTRQSDKSVKEHPVDVRRYITRLVRVIYRSCRTLQWRLFSPLQSSCILSVAAWLQATFLHHSPSIQWILSNSFCFSRDYKVIAHETGHG